MKKKLVGIIFVLGLGLSPSVYAEMSSTNFIIRADSITAGGDNTSSSASYILRDSVSPSAAGNSSSSSYNLRSGFRPMVFDEIVTLSVAAQSSSVSTNAVSLSGTNITVGSTSGFSVGDLVLLVQDVSSSHVSAVGKITGIAGSVITVDELVAATAPTVNGDGDTLYLASGSSLSYGSISSTSVTHRLVSWEVSTDVQNGFAVFVAESGDLADGSNTISDVSDGEVSAGSSEYGGRSSDTTLASSTFDSQDTAITSTPQQIGTVSGGAARFDSKGYLDVKVSFVGGSPSGTYTHSLYVVAAPIY